MSNETEQRIFISYRRSDCQSQANGLHDGLRHRLDRSRIFMDIDSIPPGADFEEHIRNEIERCHVVLVLIGDEWLEPKAGTDIRRIDEPNDFVRLEIESSLTSDHVRVVPVLVEGAQMPLANQLPESIQRLARLNAFELSDSRWSSDVERLSAQLRDLIVASPQVPPALPTMSFTDVDEHALRYALAHLPSAFKTKDLSEHPAVLATHVDVSQLRNYHTIVGRYLMQHRERLGLMNPGKPVDDRGSVWTKAGSTMPSVASHVSRATNPVAFTVPTAPVDEGEKQGRTPIVGWIMIALAAVSFGLVAFVPPLWAASQRKYDRPFRTKMYVLAGALAALMVVGFVLVGTSPTNENGEASGAGAGTGTALILVVMVAGVAVAIKYRNPGADVPGASGEFARRQLRERYRRLTETDQSLAASMLVGRPDVARRFDDGGLLDLNNMSADSLVKHGSLTRAEADSIAEARGQLGRFADLHEVIAFVDLPEGTASRLRDLAVFL